MKIFENHSSPGSNQGHSLIFLILRIKVSENRSSPGSHQGHSWALMCVGHALQARQRASRKNFRERQAESERAALSDGKSILRVKLTSSVVEASAYFGKGPHLP
jgi:hypothetical protein